ncbi:MAG: LysR family transcriptional regulator [Alphaproteobacteria bacterium]|nr:LysR family transcriptional regulator [Alphaproteobacteria bacterium]
MSRPNLPLNALRAFEASARHRSFTKAARELFVTQAAISHQVKGLEDRLGVRLFHRVPRGLMLTDEGVALLPALSESFDRIGRLLERFQDGRLREVLTVSAVGTFAVGWLLPRLAAFREAHPYVDLRLLTNNNRVDFAAEGLGAAILYGDGNWPAADAERVLDAPLSPLCTPQIAATLRQPADLARHVLLRTYRVQDWPAWFAAAGLSDGIEARGPVFDASLTMVQAALQGEGVALAPPVMFARALAEGLLAQPFAATVSTGAYWLVSPKGRPVSAAAEAFRTWLLG